MLRILSNPQIESLHSDSIRIIILILETFSSKNQYDFLGLITELILTLQGEYIFLKYYRLIFANKLLRAFFLKLDLMEFDKEFYDYDKVDSKILKRFSTIDSQQQQQITPMESDNAISDETYLNNTNNASAANKNFIIIHTPVHCSCLQTNIT